MNDYILIADRPAFGLHRDLTPGAYMRRCREASGKSIEQCAEALALSERDRRHTRNDITLMEDDRPGDFYRLARMLKDRGVFPFDMSTFLSLAAATSDRSLDELAEV